MFSKIIKTLVIVTVGIGIPFYVAYKNIFPTIEYQFNKANANKIQIFDKQIADKRYLVVPMDKSYFFDSVFLKLRFEKDNISGGQEILIKGIKNYEAMLYSEGKPIENEQQLQDLIFKNNQTGIPNGTLFSSAEAVNFISDGKYLPILSAPVFEKLGFYWENVVPMDTDIYSNLEKGEKLNYVTPHPNGTILREKSGKFYLIDNEKKYLIKNAEELLEKVWPNYNWVDVEGLEYFEQCETVVGGRKEINCEFRKTKEYQGNCYLFEIDTQAEISDAKIKLEVSPRYNSFENSIRIFLGNIKARIL